MEVITILPMLVDVCTTASIVIALTFSAHICCTNSTILLSLPSGPFPVGIPSLLSEVIIFVADFKDDNPGLLIDVHRSNIAGMSTFLMKFNFPLIKFCTVEVIFCMFIFSIYLFAECQCQFHLLYRHSLRFLYVN